MAQNILSNDAQEIAQSLKTFVSNADKAKTDVIKRANTGIDYYNGKNAILNNKIMFLDDNGQWKEDTTASNARIPHRFMTELVKQKVQYLLANPLEIELDDDKQEMLPYLEQYYNEDFQQLLQDLVTSTSQKGFDYLFAQQTTDDKISFIVADGLKITPVTDDYSNVLRIVRTWNEDVNNSLDGKHTLHHAEVYTQDVVYYFVATDKQDYVIDPTKVPNPMPHVLVASTSINGTEVSGRGFGTIPFYRLQNNANEETDLDPIKDLVDDFDIMNAYMSNDLNDLSGAIYVFRGDTDTNTAEMRTNIKAKKAVITGDTDASFDLKTYDIPFEGRKAKMDIDRDMIYKFGMGFDSSQVGDGNITNVVIMSRYTLLNMKANELETRLQKMLKWINKLVVADINRLNNTTFNPDDVTFVFNRDMLVNQADNANVEKLEADTKSENIQTLLAAAPMLDSNTVLQAICAALDLDYDEVVANKSTEEYSNDGAGIDTTD